MGSLILTTHIISRDSLGQFLSRLERDATRTVEETARKAADVARAAATVKTGAMRATIQAVMLTATSGGVVVGTNHWKYQESGTSPHAIKGTVRFFWEREGREWTPGHNTISHPGNRGVHFMQKADIFARSYFMSAARRNFV